MTSLPLIIRALNILKPSGSGVVSPQEVISGIALSLLSGFTICILPGPGWGLISLIRLIVPN